MPDMRHKLPVDMTKSDKDLWSQLPLSDIWLDAGLHNVWSYLLANKNLQIPDSWQDAIYTFDRELSNLDTWPVVVFYREDKPKTNPTPKTLSPNPNGWGWGVGWVTGHAGFVGLYHTTVRGG